MTRCDKWNAMRDELCRLHKLRGLVCDRLGINHDQSNSVIIDVLEDRLGKIDPKDKASAIASLQVQMDYYRTRWEMVREADKLTIEADIEANNGNQ